MHFEGEIRIEANRSWWKPRFREIWSYRDLLFLMVRRDFLSRYRQTVLGPAWYLVQPLITAGIFTVVFGGFTKVPTDGLPQFLFYQCGLLGFALVSQTFGGTAASFTANANIYGKVYFPRLIPPLATTLIQLVPFTLQALLLGVFWIYFKHFTDFGELLRIDSAALLFPVVLLQMMALGLGMGLVCSALTAKYRDLSHLTGFLVQVWMYLSPVIYPLSAVPDRWEWVARLNPVATSIEWMRLAFLGRGEFSLGSFGLTLFQTLVILVVGFLAFQRTERTFIDTV